MNHRAAGLQSEHATADAIDITGFVPADERNVTVARDWEGGQAPPRGLAVRDGACSFVDVVLSPDDNEAHRNRFYCDMGASRTCR
ncbi:extensin family protein [Microvirga makkahensis]|uniref:Extensin-like C-terminal domain-containing protein n=1 Tax=Microvirga makkahensis TaxID=1128670 RepID=A0A7X3MNC1_9HYPH|nr:hypothetical protein [Microvirga makkahensis]